MFQDFQYRHIPALFVACTQFWGTIWWLISGTRSVLIQHGLPARVADIPETWPVWHIGNARAACLGTLMFIFYSRRQYDVLDIFLAVMGSLTLVDNIILISTEGYSMGFWLYCSGIFAGAGLVGFTQGS
jgi:hypothetical protein